MNATPPTMSDLRGHITDAINGCVSVNGWSDARAEDLADAVTEAIGDHLTKLRMLDRLDAMAPTDSERVWLLALLAQRASGAMEHALNLLGQRRAAAREATR